MSPRWNINGTNFTVTNLPVGFQFERNSYSKVLTVNPVRQEMNNWCFYCFLLLTSSGRVESTRAKLIIRSPTETPSYYTFRSTASSVTPNISPSVVIRLATGISVSTPAAYPPALSSAVPTFHSEVPTFHSEVPTSDSQLPAGENPTTIHSSPLIRKFTDNLDSL